MNQSNTNVIDVRNRVFGFDKFREGQEAVMGRLLAGRSTLAVFPTGSGKSLCYQLPAILLNGVTLVVSPLIALMKDQIDFLRSKNIAAARLDSTLKPHELAAVGRALDAQKLKLLYVAPERFAGELFMQRIRRLPIGLMVIDEAHCISEWGHNFRPDYLKLARVARDLRIPRVLTLTATATPKVATQIRQEFGIAREDYINTGFHRPNLTLYATPCDGLARDDLLLARLCSRPPGSTIVYVTLRRTAEEVAELLVAEGFAAKAYHAGMGGDGRSAVQDWFMESDRGIVVATIAFGMGIDKADIRYVYHYNLPKGPENYAQEIGRAGRDGRRSTCEVLVCEEDVDTLEGFARSKTPATGPVISMLNDVLSRGEKFDISLHELNGKYGIDALTVSTLLCYLELLDVLQSAGTFYNQAGVRRSFRLLKRPSSISALAQGLMQRCLAAEQRALGRVRHMVELAMQEECLVRGILAYFGEELGRECGHCDRCLGETGGRASAVQAWRAGRRSASGR